LDLIGNSEAFKVIELVYGGSMKSSGMYIQIFDEEGDLLTEVMMNKKSYELIAMLLQLPAVIFYSSFIILQTFFFPILSSGNDCVYFAWLLFS
jgi:hypothetical protein